MTEKKPKPAEDMAPPHEPSGEELLTDNRNSSVRDAWPSGEELIRDDDVLSREDEVFRNDSDVAKPSRSGEEVKQ